MDEDEAKKLHKYAHKRAMGTRFARDADDIAQNAVLKRLEGETGNVDQLFVDFLRANYGDTRSKYRQGQKRVAASRADRLVSPSETGRELGFEGVQRFLSDNGGWFSQRDRATLTMKFQWEMTNQEIAQAFGISDRKVRYLLKEILDRVRLLLEVKPKKRRAG